MSSTFAGVLTALRKRDRSVRRSRDGRVIHGMSQMELAERAGFDHSYISRIETGARHPTRASVLRLAFALRLDDVDADDLLAAAGYARIGDGMEPCLVEAARALRDEAIPEDVRAGLRLSIALLARLATL